MAEDGGHDAPGGGVEEERKVEEREEDRPARAEEQEARPVAHREREEVVPEVEPAHEPGRDRELRRGRRVSVGRGEGRGGDARASVAAGDLPR